MKKDEQTQYFSTAEVAKALGVSRTAILKRIRSGSIPARKVGRSYIISAEEMQSLTGAEITPKQKEEISNAVKKAVKEYGPAFERLGREE